jgi:hypothetical protein
MHLLLEHIATHDYDIVCLQELFICRAFGFALFNELEMVMLRMRDLGFVYHTDPTRSCHKSWSSIFPLQNA